METLDAQILGLVSGSLGRFAVPDLLFRLIKLAHIRIRESQTGEAAAGKTAYTTVLTSSLRLTLSPVLLAVSIYTSTSSLGAESRPAVPFLPNSPKVLSFLPPVRTVPHIRTLRVVLPGLAAKLVRAPK